MTDVYDAVVIGAGIGGLIAAARLARAGKRVLVLERRGYAGGTASAYGRGGFIFPTGPLGFSSPGVVEGALRELGVGDGLAFQRVHYRLKAFGTEAIMSLPYTELATELAWAFNTDEVALRRFFSDIERVASALRSAFEEHRPPVPGEVIDEPAADYLERLFPDWRLRRPLGSMGAREPAYGFPVLAAPWRRPGRLRRCSRCAWVWMPAGSTFPSLTGRAALSTGRRQGWKKRGSTGAREGWTQPGWPPGSSR